VRRWQQVCRDFALILPETIKWALLSLWLVGLLEGLSATAQQSSAIRVEQTVNPAQIVMRGTGAPSVATVTLKLSGPAVSGAPIDAMLILDRSASVDIEMVKGIARTFVGHLSGDDRVGIVSFADTAKVELSLTNNKTQALQAVEGLIPGVQTALGDGLMLGLNELIQNGRANAVKMILLPTDGVNNAGQDPLLQAPKAAEKQIPIYSIAITSAARRQLLSQLADMTQGAYFTSFGDDALERVLRKANRTVAGRFIVITETLPSYWSYEGSTENPPAVNRGRNVTQLEWHISLLFQGGVWQSQFSISASQEGMLTLSQEPSGIQYTDSQGQTVTMALPTTTVQVNRGTGSVQPPPPPGTTQPPPPPPPSGTLTAKVKFTPDAPIAGDALRFDASESTAASGQITKYEWDWTNDGTFDESFTEPTALHVFGGPGEFTTKLRITDSQGATAETTITVRLGAGLRAQAALTTDFRSDPTIPSWMNYYIDDGVVTDEEVRDANARFAADVFIPGTQYRLTQDDVEAINQINKLTKLVAKYQDVTVAKSDGYIKVGEFIPEVGQHYVKEAFLSGPALVDRPPVLLYDLEAEGKLRLAGVRYISLETGSRLFQITNWPSHPAAAHYEDGSEQAVAQISQITTAQLKNSRGSPLAFWHPTLYGLSVWVSIVNPKGLFASTNPEVKQP